MRIPAEGAREAEAKASKDDQLPGEHRLSDEQRTIVALAAKQPLSILAGGPGTGKTFAAKFVVRSRRPVV
jgi:ATP-dependent exoDNAse (exonuclease V) alpha subunit